MARNEEMDRYVRTALIAAVLGAVVILIALSDSIGLELLTGWFYFAVRVVPKVKVRGDGIAIFMVGTLIVCALTHFFLQWLVHESQLKRQVPLVRWRVSSSVSLVVIVLLIFGIGISMAGIVHQVGWIVNSPESRFTGEVQTSRDSLRSPYRPGVLANNDEVSWIFATLPFSHYVQPLINRSEPWNGELNITKVKGLVIETLCPSQGYPHKSPDGLGLTHVVGNRELTESGGTLGLKDIEGASQTIMAGEIQVGFSPWAMPKNGRSPKHGLRHDWSEVPNESLGFGSSHTRGANLMMVDGSVQFLSDKTDPVVLEQLGKLKVQKTETSD